MRAYVFTDPSLTRHAGRFVWLEIDTEKRVNAGVRRKLAPNALPTFLILDPVTEKVALRWVGGFGVAQLDRLLEDGRLAVGGGSGAPAVDAALVRADALYGEAKYAEAAAAYRGALAQAPPDWPRYGRAVEAALFSLSQSDSFAAALALAREAWPRLRRQPSGATVAASGLDAALHFSKEDVERAPRIAEFEAAVRDVLADSTLALAGDDRSGLYIALLDARKDAGDAEGASQVATEWSGFLDGEAAKARTPDERTVFDSHRLSACLETGHPERAIPMLEASERDHPGDYNPPARLAIAWRAMKEWDRALAASDRAMALAYGPRKLGFFNTRSDIFLGRADTSAAVKTLEWGLAYADSLPEGQRPQGTIGALKKKLEGLNRR